MLFCLELRNFEEIMNNLFFVILASLGISLLSSGITTLIIEYAKKKPAVLLISILLLLLIGMITYLINSIKTGDSK